MKNLNSGKNPLYKYTFYYGHYDHMKVFIRAKNIEKAIERAKRCLDLKYERRGDECPVAWTLKLNPWR